MLILVDTRYTKCVSSKVRVVEGQSAFYRGPQYAVLVIEYRHFDRSFCVECRRTLNIYEYRY